MTRSTTIILVALLRSCNFAQTSQAPNPNPLSAEAKQMYTGVKNNLTKMAEKMPEENYAFKATADVRTFGQLIGHVADSQARTCSMVIGATRPPAWPAKPPKPIWLPR
ncbi:MAG: hypothetical protein U0Y68_07890 [Blastocatellia bacterium]